MKAVLLLAVIGTLAACGGRGDGADSPARGGNGLTRFLFGGGPEREVIQPPVANVVDMQLDRHVGGLILRATGLPPTQGFYDGVLEPQNGGLPQDGVLSYRFLLTPPPGQKRVSTQRSREVVVATFISDQQLAGVTEIRVLGLQNSLGRRSR